MNISLVLRKPPWRNRLARSAVNRKVGGSSPPGGDQFFFLLQVITNVTPQGETDFNVLPNVQTDSEAHQPLGALLMGGIEVGREALRRV